MLNTAVLVLNRNFQPIHVTNVKRAFTLLYLGIARAIDAQYRTYEFEDWAQLAASEKDSVPTLRRRIRVPRVVILQAYELMPRARIRFSRLNIYARDADTCQYCARQLPRRELNLDHVVPRSQGGKTSWENVVCSCISCNFRKGGRTPEQAKMRLIRTPVRPRWTPLFRGALMKETYREWLPFLNAVDAAYWHVELAED